MCCLAALHAAREVSALQEEVRAETGNGTAPTISVSEPSVVPSEPGTPTDGAALELIDVQAEGLLDEVHAAEECVSQLVRM